MLNFYALFTETYLARGAGVALIAGNCIFYWSIFGTETLGLGKFDFAFFILDKVLSFSLPGDDLLTFD
jgi:hypothetical protein